MLVGSIGILFAYSDAGPNKLVNIILMTLLGITVSGPYNLIVGTISVDLGSQPALAGNPKAMSTVTGLIDACGSLGSAVGQLFVPVVQNGLGWNYVFYLFIIMVCGSLLSICFTIPVVKVVIYRHHFPSEIEKENDFEMKDKTIHAD